jgi:hypothetical protein
MRVLRSFLVVAIVALTAGCGGSYGSNASTFQINPSPIAGARLTFPPKSHASGTTSGMTLTGTSPSAFYVIPVTQSGGFIVNGLPITVVSSDPSKLTVAAGRQYGEFVLKSQRKSGARTTANLTIHIDPAPRTSHALTVVVPVTLLGG